MAESKYMASSTGNLLLFKMAACQVKLGYVIGNIESYQFLFIVQVYDF